MNVVLVSISKAHQTIDSVLVWKWSGSEFDEEYEALQLYPSMVGIH